MRKLRLKEVENNIIWLGLKPGPAWCPPIHCTTRLQGSICAWDASVWITQALPSDEGVQKLLLRSTPTPSGVMRTVSRFTTFQSLFSPRLERTFGSKSIVYLFLHLITGISP